MKKVLGIIVLLLFLFSCGNEKGKRMSQAAIQNRNLDSLRTEQLRYTIITNAEQAELGSAGGISFWTPNREQITTVISLAKQAIAERGTENSRYLRADSLSTSYKQFVFYVDEGGDSLVYINSMCQVGKHPVTDSNGRTKLCRDDWQKKVIRVHDGGDCYWRMKINLSKKKVLSLFENGMA